MITVYFEMFLYAIFIIFLYHSIRNRKSSTINFFLPLFIFTFIAEELATSAFHGFEYPGYAIYILDVPLGIICGWCSIVYLSFHLAKKIQINSPTSFKISLFGALIGLGFDFILFEPAAKMWNLWVWNKPNVYFNASIENFISWFLIIFLYINFYLFTENNIKNNRNKFLLSFAIIPIELIILTLIIFLWKLTINL